MRKTTLATAILLVVAMATPAAAAQTSTHGADSGFVVVDNGARVPTRNVDWSDPLSVEGFLLRVKDVQGSDSIAWLDADTTPSEIQEAVIATITRNPDAVNVIEFTVPMTRQANDQMLQSMFGEGAVDAALAGWTCGWGYKKVQYKPGLIAYYWFSLRTDFCWNGTNVQATPVQDVNGDGSWGWSYEGCVTCTVTGWPSPTDYKSYAKGHMNLGQGVDWNRYPWIQHIVHGNGTVSTTSHD